MFRTISCNLAENSFHSSIGCICLKDKFPIEIRTNNNWVGTQYVLNHPFVDGTDCFRWCEYVVAYVIQPVVKLLPWSVALPL